MIFRTNRLCNETGEPVEFLGFHKVSIRKPVYIICEDYMHGRFLCPVGERSVKWSPEFEAM